jgi:hypothetical protein
MQRRMLAGGNQVRNGDGAGRANGRTGDGAGRGMGAPAMGRTGAAATRPRGDAANATKWLNRTAQGFSPGLAPKKIALKGRPTGHAGQARARSPHHLQNSRLAERWTNTVLIRAPFQGAPTIVNKPRARTSPFPPVAHSPHRRFAQFTARSITHLHYAGAVSA